MLVHELDVAICASGKNIIYYNIYTVDSAYGQFTVEEKMLSDTEVVRLNVLSFFHVGKNRKKS